MATISAATATRGKNGTNDTEREGDTTVGATIVDLEAARELKFLDPREWIYDLTRSRVVGVAADTKNLHDSNENFSKTLKAPQLIRIEEDETIEVPKGATLTVFRKLYAKNEDGWPHESRLTLAAIVIRRSPSGRDTQITIRMDGRVSVRDLQPLQ